MIGCALRECDGGANAMGQWGAAASAQMGVGTNRPGANQLMLTNTPLP
jgi:hypothetical protein